MPRGGGPEGRRGRVTRAGLSRGRILDAALGIIDTHGVRGLTMRSLGRSLGVDPMAVYRHFENKPAVLDALVASLWEGALGEALSARSEDWQELTMTVMQELRRALLVHPRALELVAARPVSSSDQVAMAERALAALEAAGARPSPDLLVLLNVLTAFTIGHLAAEVPDPATGTGAGATAGATGGVTAGASGSGSCPRSPGTPTFDAATTGFVFSPDAQFERGLRAIMSGWEWADQ